MIPKRILVVVAAASLALLAGCGSGATASGEETSGVGTRTVTDSTGADIEVPADPTSIATLHYAGTQALQDLGLTPSGQGEYMESQVPEDRLGALQDVPVVSGQEPDLEKIAEVAPDLILAPNIYEPDIIEQLEEVAPVYQFTLRGGDRANWTQRVEEVAEAVNRTGELDALASDFASAQQRIAEEHAEEIKGMKVGVVSSFKENTAYLWGGDNMTGTLLKPLGFEWSADEDAMVAANAGETEEAKKTGKVEPEAEVSYELLDKSLADADIIFVTSDLRGEYDELTKSLLDSAVFKDLPAAKAGRVYPGGKATIGGYADAHYGVAQAEKAIEDSARG